LRYFSLSKAAFLIFSLVSSLRLSPKEIADNFFFVSSVTMGRFCAAMDYLSRVSSFGVLFFPPVSEL